QIRWLDDQGEPVSCIAKLDVLVETLTELRQAAQDALEDAILMGCREAQMRDVLRSVIDGLVNPYRKD
ncbi:MAG: hypothetical protein QOJ54_1136, partial [Aliidongia sp.]|nr:hypothetical protein [Aliidongia sp.]